jgi:hypothetical protein
MLRPSAAWSGSCGRPTPEPSLWGTQAAVVSGRVQPLPLSLERMRRSGATAGHWLRQPWLVQRRFGHVPLEPL